MQILVLFIFVYFCNCIAIIQNFIYIFGMECYKCKFYCTGNPICIECASKNPEMKESRCKLRTVSLDSGIVEGSGICKLDEQAYDEPFTDMIPREIAYELASFFRSWLRLPSDERDIVAILAQREFDGAKDPSLDDIAIRFGITGAGVRYKIAHACKAVPPLRALFPRMSIARI